ncbi:MAG: ABC transporter permease [Planctomycetes bacterium]|nr:ABC transporter permease [Planctomycetota bacterium]
MLIKEFKLLIRDRQSLLLLFLMPVSLILVISLALKDVHGKMVSNRVKLEIVDHDESLLSKKFIETLKKTNSCRIVEGGDERKQALVTIKKGFANTSSLLIQPLALDLEEDVMLNSGNATMDEMEVSENSELDGVLVFVAEPSLEQVYRHLIRHSLNTALISCIVENELETEAFSSDSSVQSDLTSSLETVIKEGSGKRQAIPTPLQQTVPAWAIFSMFFIIIPLSNSLITERKNSLLQRLRTYPISSVRIILGKLMPYYCVTLMQFFLMILFGFFIGPILGVPKLELGAHPLTLLPITLCVGLTATSFGIMIANLAKTFEQASAVGPFAVVIMAMMGGIMIPIFVMPDFMQTLAQVSPLYWSLEAYHCVFISEGSLIDVLPGLGVLLIFSMIFFMIGIVSFRWE